MLRHAAARRFRIRATALFGVVSGYRATSTPRLRWVCPNCIIRRMWNGEARRQALTAAFPYPGDAAARLGSGPRYLLSDDRPVP